MSLARLPACYLVLALGAASMLSFANAQEVSSGVPAHADEHESHAGEMHHHHMMPSPETGDMKVPGTELDPGLGELHHPVSTTSKDAQLFFDQGLKLTYAFNHEAAIESYRQAIKLDPNLAMAYWGIANALGPNINSTMSPEAHKKAYQALRQAIRLKSHATPQERAYIDALAHRYSAKPDAATGPLYLAYKDAMAQLSKRFPDDNDAAVLYAESLMDLHPWKLWRPDGTPEEGTQEIVAVLERVLKREPMHIGANHYYVHAVEMSPHPEIGLESAHRLETLAPSAGHLVHMPAHIYIRTGEYLDAVRVNEEAARADERLRDAGGKSEYLVGYYGHNLHFLTVSAAFAGAYEKSIAAANKLAAMVQPELKEVSTHGYLDSGYFCMPMLVDMMFDRWDNILARQEPPAETPVSRSYWHMSRALAFAAKGQGAEAQVERDIFVTDVAAADPGGNDTAKTLAVAVPYLDGRLAFIAGNMNTAVADFRLAAAAEERLSYDEPPDWILGSNEALGRALLKQGKAADAEAAFRADLRHNIASGRSLYGLQQALRQEGKAAEADATQAKFLHAWRGADTKLAMQ